MTVADKAIIGTLENIESSLAGVMQHCTEAAGRSRKAVSMSGDFAGVDIDGASYALGCVATYVELRTMIKEAQLCVATLLEDTREEISLGKTK